mmetsp:Transcript_31525/g.61522  ORF Transcript_31525/g.61522 Transcript_31525/m.61522 type:complete len:204 (-) Transcript_31525:99-710(-)
MLLLHRLPEIRERPWVLPLPRCIPMPLSAPLSDLKVQKMLRHDEKPADVPTVVGVLKARAYKHRDVLNSPRNVVPVEVELPVYVVGALKVKDHAKRKRPDQRREIPQRGGVHVPLEKLLGGCAALYPHPLGVEACVVVPGAPEYQVDADEDPGGGLVDHEGEDGSPPLEHVVKGLVGVILLADDELLLVLLCEDERHILALGR